MNLEQLVVRFFLNSGNLIYRSTGISVDFRESLRVRDNESRLYIVGKMARFASPLCYLTVY